MNRYSSAPVLKRSHLTACLGISPEKSANNETGLHHMKTEIYSSNRPELDSQFYKYFERRVYYSEIKNRTSNPIFYSKNKHEISHSPRKSSNYEPNRQSSPNLRHRKDGVVSNLLSKNLSRTSFNTALTDRERKQKGNKVLISTQPTDTIRFPLKSYFKDFNLSRDLFRVDQFKSNTVLGSIPLSNFSAHYPKFKSFNSRFLPDSKEKRRKRMTCMRHLSQLKPTKYEIYHLNELMPDKPFSKPRAIDFLRACKSRNINYLKEMIAEDKWIVHVYDSSGENGLHWACKRDSIEVVRALLDGGCFVDSRDYAGRTPLYIAVRYNSEGCVQMLLENKAAINLSSYSGRKIFDVLQRSSMKSILKRYHTTKLKSSIAKSIQGNREKNARLDK
jgi:hypothetical protein